MYTATAGAGMKLQRRFGAVAGDSGSLGAVDKQCTARIRQLQGSGRKDCTATPGTGLKRQPLGSVPRFEGAKKQFRRPSKQKECFCFLGPRWCERQENRGHGRTSQWNANRGQGVYGRTWQWNEAAAERLRWALGTTWVITLRDRLECCKRGWHKAGLGKALGVARVVQAPDSRWSQAPPC